MSFNPSQPRVPSGQAGGGRWGAPRNAQAATAQKNTTAQKHYTAVRALPPSQRASYVKNLSDADLEALTAILYSSRTSDPDVVNARIAAANEMSKRGIDIKKYGALGGGGVSAHQAVKKAAQRRAAVHHVLAQHRNAQPVKALPKAAPHQNPGRRPV